MSQYVITALCVSVIVLAILYLLLESFRIKGKNIAIFYAIIFGVALLTNPRREDHIAAVMKYSFAGNEGKYPVQSEVLATNLATGVISNMVERNNYLFISLTKVSRGSDSRIIGIGAFGNVWILKD